MTIINTVIYREMFINESIHFGNIHFRNIKHMKLNTARNINKIINIF